MYFLLHYFYTITLVTASAISVLTQVETKHVYNHNWTVYLFYLNLASVS